MGNETHLDLFTGIGGFHLAAQWAGFETVGFSEIDPYCCKLLAGKWPKIPNYGDIRTADFNGLRGRIAVLSAGVPCQPASLAGKRRGSSDDRWLWPAVLDVVRRVQPAWAIFENPPGILTLDEFGGVLLRLESLGYAVRLFSVPANAVGAKHRRQRVFIVGNAVRTCRTGAQWTREQSEEHAGPDGIVANRNSGNQRECSWSGWWSEPCDSSEALADTLRTRGWQESRGASGDEGADEGRAKIHGDQPDGSGEALADTGCKRCEERPERNGESDQSGIEPSRGNDVERCRETLADADRAGLEEHESRLQRELAPIVGSSGPLRFRLTQPPLCRRVDGIPDRSYRLKALGNAVVPQQAYPFFAAIHQVQTSDF